MEMGKQMFGKYVLSGPDTIVNKEGSVLPALLSLQHTQPRFFADSFNDSSILGTDPLYKVCQVVKGEVKGTTF